jgi:DNA-binding GntR family transcriptional regulator
MYEYKTQGDKALVLSGDHRLILEALRKEDVESAVSLMRNHLKRGSDRATLRSSVSDEKSMPDVRFQRSM